MTKEARIDLGSRLLAAVTTTAGAVGIFLALSRHWGEAIGLIGLSAWLASLAAKFVMSLARQRWSTAGAATGLIWGSLAGLVVFLAVDQHLAQQLALFSIPVGAVFGVALLCRSADAGFWLGVPTVVAALVVSERRIVIYLSGPLTYDRPASLLPDLVADAIYQYPATLFATAILLIASKRRTGASRAPNPSPFFLPVYVFSIESMRHAIWCMRCHGGVSAVDPHAFVSDEAWRSAIVVASVFACGLMVSRQRQPDLPWRDRIPGGVSASVVSVGLIWWVLLKLIEP